MATSILLLQFSFFEEAGGGLLYEKPLNHTSFFVIALSVLQWLRKMKNVHRMSLVFCCKVLRREASDKLGEERKDASEPCGDGGGRQRQGCACRMASRDPKKKILIDTQWHSWEQIHLDRLRTKNWKMITYHFLHRAHFTAKPQTHLQTHRERRN